MTRLGIENISVFGLPPVQFVELASDLGCECISTGLTSYDFGIHDYPPFSLRDDAALRREMMAAMKDLGITISLGEGLTIRPGKGAKDHESDLDIMCELGVETINTVSMDPDLSRTFDEFCIMAEMVAARGRKTTMELAPSLTICDLPTAVAAVRHVGRTDFSLLIDTMHVVRSGSRVEDVAALDPELIGYVQLCDAPLKSRFETYFEESMYERMVPGDGELGLKDLLAVLPADRTYSLELPLREEALAGIGPRERLSKCVTAARRMLAEAHGV